MLTFTEAQLTGWLTPLLWPFLRVLALMGTMPVFGQRSVPMRVRVGLAFLVAVCVQPGLPPVPAVPLDSPQAVMVVVQQLVIGIALGFAVRIVFAAIEFAGELVGLQMGLNFAGFFDPASGGQTTAVARFYAIAAGWLFVVINGHLLVIAGVAGSFGAFPVSAEPFEFLRDAQPQTWGAEVFRLGLWIALPMVAMLLFVNLVLGIVSRVAQQLNIFSVGFPVTLGVGLLGVLMTLPFLQAPFTMALEQMLARFR